MHRANAPGVTEVPHGSFAASLREIAEATGGEVAEGREAVSVRGVSTDTRSIERGELFVALVGQQHDGHDFLAVAQDAGAAAAVVSKPETVPEDLPVVVVEDTLEAYGALGRMHRQRMPARIAAVTGSTGKTTTKDMLGEMLSLVGPTLAARGTRNNEVGVPQTLLELTEEHRFCVLELAMRGPGEIDYLARIAEPDVGVITNIGQSHVGRLGLREAIAQAKAELLPHLADDGVAVLNADDFFYDVLRAMAQSPVVAFGTAENADFRAVQIDDSHIDSVSFRLISPLGEAEVRMGVPGRHNVMNALAASAAAAHLGASLRQLTEALERHAGASMRMQRVDGPNGSMLINDAYNASPDSVAAALQVLSASSGRRLFVFGDMLEMGPEAEPAHREVGRLAAQAGVDHLVTVGELAAFAAEEALQLGVRTERVSDASAAAEALREELGPGDVVLVKASRGMKLERVVEELSDDE